MSSPAGHGVDPEHLGLFLIVGGAAVAPFLSRRLRVPAPVLEILYGAALFHSLLREQPDWFQLLRELGFLYLMFIAGMELDLRDLLGSRRPLWYVFAAASSLGLAAGAFWAAGAPPYLGLSAAMISAGIVIPVLKETGLSRAPLGRDIAGTALVGEVLCILVLTAVDTYAAYGVSLDALWMLVKLAGLLAAATAALKAIYLLGWWHPEWVERVMTSQDPAEEGIRGVIVLAFAGAVLAEAAGVEPILGSFMAGLITTHVFPSKGMFEDKVNAVGFGFFTPFFFVGVGADLRPELLTDPGVVAWAGILTLTAVGSKLPAAAVARALGHGVQGGLQLGLLLAAPLSMMVVAGALGERMGLLTPRHTGALVLAAMASSLACPYLFRALVERRALEEAATET
ncbi:MAG: monovalent cation:proton antiporter-2 (CPA2) family protein [Deferrisomatales bacterium]